MVSCAYSFVRRMQWVYAVCSFPQKSSADLVFIQVSNARRSLSQGASDVVVVGDTVGTILFTAVPNIRCAIAEPVPKANPSFTT